MKPILVALALACLIAGGVYHEEVSRYVASLSGGPTQYGGSGYVVDSVKGVGNANNNLMKGIGNALGQ